MSNCPRCDSSLIKQLSFTKVQYSCINPNCNYCRIITKQKATQILETKIKCFQNGKAKSGNYKIHITENGARKGLTLLEIHVEKYNKNTIWKWYLEDLLHLGKYSKDMLLKDQLYLDWTKKIYVTGMLKAYQEIINSIILKGISI